MDDRCSGQFGGDAGNAMRAKRLLLRAGGRRPSQTPHAATSTRAPKASGTGCGPRTTARGMRIHPQIDRRPDDLPVRHRALSSACSSSLELSSDSQPLGRFTVKAIRRSGRDSNRRRAPKLLQRASSPCRAERCAGSVDASALPQGAVAGAVAELAPEMDEQQLRPRWGGVLHSPGQAEGSASRHCFWHEHLPVRGERPGPIGRLSRCCELVRRRDAAGFRARGATM